MLVFVDSSASRAAKHAEATLSSRFVRVVYCDKALFSGGMKLFKQRTDKEWGSTDCVSFAAMKKCAIRTAFSFDAHFKQAGLAIIP